METDAEVPLSTAKVPSIFIRFFLIKNNRNFYFGILKCTFRFTFWRILKYFHPNKVKNYIISSVLGCNGKRKKR